VQATGTPRSVCWDIFGPQPQQAQSSHEGDRHRALDAVRRLGHLRLPQAPNPCQFSAPPFHPPPAPRHADTLPCGAGLRPLGHEALGGCRPLVAPTLAADPGDVSRMAPARACGIDPTGPAAVGVHRRPAHRGLRPARQLRDAGFERCPMGQRPGPGQGQHGPVAPRLEPLHMGSGGVGRRGGAPQRLAPGRAPERLPHGPQHRMFGLVGGSGGATAERDLHREASGIPLGHAEDHPNAKDVGLVRAEACLLGPRMWWPPLALERTVAHHREAAVRGWGKRLQGLVGNPPQPGRGAPLPGTPPTSGVVLGQRRGAMPGQGLQVGPFAVEEGPSQEPAEDPLVPMVATRPHDPPALRHAAGQPGHGQGPGLLGETSSDGQSCSSIPGRTWTVKDLHAWPCSNLSLLSI
jgi:hypothetical protein